MSDDIELLRRYVAEKSEAAFADLVRHHLGLVYHTALRHLNGDTHAAEDVAQAVFTDLARKAASLTDRPLLAGWLHTGARYAALQHVRSTRRRQVREQEAQLMQETNQSDEAPMPWDQLRGVIDEALLALNPRDREAVLMRYFEGRDYPAVAARLNLSASGARICVERALDKMQARLARHGIRSSVAALGSALAAHAAAEGPGVLVAGIARTALHEAATAAAGVAANGGATAAGAGGFSLGSLGAWKLSSLLLAGSLAGNAALGVVLLNSHGTAAAPGEGGVAPAAAKVSVPAPPAMTQLITDPVEIGRRLQAAGFSDKTVTSAAGSAVTLERGPAARAEGESYHARIRRWNPSPQGSVAVAPGLTPPESVRFARSPEMLRRNAVYAELGYDATGVPFAALFRNLSAEKAKAVRRIEEDYEAIREAGTTRIGNSGQISRAAMNEIATQFEHDIRAALTPAEATDYFRYHSEATRQEQSVLSSFPMSDEAYAAIADAALEIDRLRRQSTGMEAIFPTQMAQLEAYRRGLGDEKMLRALSRLPGSQFAQADAVFQQAGLAAAKRVDLYFAYIRSVANPAQDRAVAAAQLYAALTTGAGLTAEQIAALDATRLGQQLKRSLSPR